MPGNNEGSPQKKVAAPENQDHHHDHHAAGAKGITGRDARHRGGLRAAAMIEAASHDDRRRIGVIFDEAEADGAHGTKWLATQLAYAGAFFAGRDGVDRLTFRILTDHISDYQ
jgi:hypothetical protein